MVYNWLKFDRRSLDSKRCLLCLGPVQISPIQSRAAFSKPRQKLHSICSACENDLPLNRFHCVICAAPFPPPQTDEISDTSLVCGACQKSPPTFHSSIIPYLYALPLKQLITALKFHGNLSYVPLLAQLFINSLTHRQHNLPDCIIPVPLHKHRLRERGFNQALELAKIIAKHFNIHLDYSFCQRCKSTPFQSGLNEKERKKNLRNAFEVSKDHQYKHVAIFDDVVTTGTTANELAGKLKQSGVEIIEVWAIARTFNKNS